MTTTEPTTLADVHNRYQEIAPEPMPDSLDVARDLTRRLLVSAIRRDNRLTAGILGGESFSAEDHAALIGEFAAAHLLQELVNNAPAIADESAAVIAGAALDGSVGEWVRQHAQTLGIDTAEVDRLAAAEARLRVKQADLKVMLSTLIDRTEGNSVLTDDERAEYRQRAGLSS